MRTPNPDTHFKISAVKSAWRVIAGTCLIMQHFATAEILGVAEEIF